MHPNLLILLNKISKSLTDVGLFFCIVSYNLMYRAVRKDRIQWVTMEISEVLAQCGNL